MRERPAQLLYGNLFDTFTATRRAILPDPPWDPAIYGFEDWDLWVRLLFRYHAEVGMLAGETGGYRQRAASISTHFQDLNPAYQATWIQVYAKILRDFPEFPADVRHGITQQLVARGHQWVAATLTPAPMPPAPLDRKDADDGHDLVCVADAQ
jgi:hypothetical protein